MLETVAALTILASGAVVVFSWLSQTTLQMDRYANAEIRNLGQVRALAYLRSLNPATHTTGSQAFEGFTLSWHAQPLGGSRSSLTAAGTQDNYDIGLFAVTATLEDAVGHQLAVMNLTLAGYTMPRNANAAPIFSN